MAAAPRVKYFLHATINTKQESGQGTLYDPQGIRTQPTKFAASPTMPLSR